MTTLVVLLVEARRVGVTLDRDGDDLVLRGPRDARPLLQQVATRKAEVLAAVAFYTGVVPVLDWRDATLADKPGRCALCGAKCVLLDPWDRVFMHKVCAQDAIRTGVVPTGRRAAA